MTAKEVKEIIELLEKVPKGKRRTQCIENITKILKGDTTDETKAGGNEKSP